MAGGLAHTAVDILRRVDSRAFGSRGPKNILVDGRTPVNYVMVAPVYQAMQADPRVRFFFTASEEPGRLREIYSNAPRTIRLISPRRAALRKFDAYLASDFMWATLPRGTCRIQVFHGVGGKYGFDAPTTSMRVWDRLFFVNERRMQNFIAAGAIDADSPAARLVGMPKVDCLVDGSLERDSILADLGLNPDRPTVLYAPTWSPASSLNAFGEDLIRGLIDRPVNVLVKLHDRSRDLRARYSGGRDWMAALAPIVAGRDNARLLDGHDISPYLVASDVMITDHSSAGFEYLLLDRPLVRIYRPALIEVANIHPDYVRLLGEAALSVNTLAETLAGVDRALGNPGEKSATRKRVAADLFHQPGTATGRAVAGLYEAMELDAPVVLPATRGEGIRGVTAIMPEYQPELRSQQ
ncbi:MAG: CDP-glycerol glycerophosphotransferase family protein [Acidobacteriota bacterium]